MRAVGFEQARAPYPVLFNTSQTMVIELGARYFSFPYRGARPSCSRGRCPTEIGEHLRRSGSVRYSFRQVGRRVLTLVHRRPPAELRRQVRQAAVLSSIGFALVSPRPATRLPRTSGHRHHDHHNYVVTATASDGVTESQASVVATCTNNLFTTGRRKHHRAVSRYLGRRGTRYICSPAAYTLHQPNHGPVSGG